jgi:peptidyl-prolyl cis-trans isomerase D
MLTSLRQASKSKIGTIVVAVVGLLIVIGFGSAGVTGLDIGGLGGMSSSTLAKVGSLEVTDSDMGVLMQRDLESARQQNPNAGYASIVGDFDPLLDQMIDQRAVVAFAQSHGFRLSKRLIDGEIANLPGVRGLGGDVSEQAYQSFLARQHMTDEEVRQVIAGSMLQRLLITPGATGVKVPAGVATPYAAMLLEQRQGEIALVPLAQFTAGLNPTDAQLQQFYQQNKAHYVVPEQRVLKIAEVGPDQVANVHASDQEIAQYYNQHQDDYAAQDVRTIEQAVVPDQNTANQIAQRAKGGASFVDAVKPAGLSAQDVSIGPQTRSQFASLANDKVAAAAFAAPSGAVVGPIQSPLGWHVVKIDSVQKKPGKSLAQAKSEIQAKLDVDKRKTALSDFATKFQNSLDGGSNIDEAAKAAGVAVTTTPLITADGTARGNPSYKFPADLTPVLKSGFDLQPNEEPVIEALADNKGFAVVAPAQIVPAAPAPFDSVRDQVKTAWIQQQAIIRAQAVAKQIAAKANGSVSLADAIKQSNVSIPAPQTVTARRIQLAQLGDKAPPPMAMLFTLGEGKSNVVADSQGRGFFVVKNDKITPGNVIDNPNVIGQVENQFSDPMSQELAQELQTAIRNDVKVKKNESAIQAEKARLANSGG